MFYKPSWASHVDVTVSCAKLDDIAGLDSITLQHADMHTLHIADATARQPAEVFVGTKESDSDISLELGKDLVVARYKVAQAAQKFFNDSQLL